MGRKKDRDAGQVNLITGSTQVEGTIRTASPVRIDGRFSGELHSEEMVVVGQTGFMQGQIHAREIIVEGQVEGTLVGTDIVHLTKTARVQGTLITRTLIVDEGAIFNGECRMGENVHNASHVATSEPSGELLETGN